MLQKLMLVSQFAVTSFQIRLDFGHPRVCFSSRQKMMKTITQAFRGLIYSSFGKSPFCKESLLISNVLLDLAGNMASTKRKILIAQN